MTENVVIDDEKLADAEFAAGFGTVTPPATADVPGVEVVVEARPAQPKVGPKTEPKPAPKYVQITQDQFDRLQSAATKTTAMETQLSKVFGTVGDMQQIVKKLQASTPSGQSIEIPKDAFAEMEQDFPELAAKLRNGLEKTLKNVRGTGQATEPDTDTMKALVQRAYIAGETEALEDAHPTWREIVGVVDSTGKHDPNHPFRGWLAKQDVAYQHRVNNTNSARVIARAIDRFQAATKTAPTQTATPAPKLAARADRIRSAIQPRGDGGQPAPNKTADDDFREGFRTG